VRQKGTTHTKKIVRMPIRHGGGSKTGGRGCLPEECGDCAKSVSKGKQVGRVEISEFRKWSQQSQERNVLGGRESVSQRKEQRAKTRREWGLRPFLGKTIQMGGDG